jgi:uncharacterized Zn-binding protein involved in type VI secretion
MPSVARLGDKTTGHDGFPSRLIISCSENVFVNGIGVARIGDKQPTHSCCKSSHDSVLSQCSENVFVNGIGVARIGDKTTCNDTVAEGSENVFCN